MKSIKEKQLLVKWAKAMGEPVDPALVEEVERYEKLQKEITESIKSNTIQDLIDAAQNTEIVIQTSENIIPVSNTQAEIIKIEYPKPPTLDELEALLQETHDELVQAEAAEISTAAVQATASEEEQKAEEEGSLIERAAKHITKEAVLEGQSFQQPEPEAPRSLEDLKKKIKYLETWISKIAVTGQGGGEVNLRYLDDVNTGSFNLKNPASRLDADGLAVIFNAANNKFELKSAATAGISAGDNITIDANGRINSSISANNTTFPGITIRNIAIDGNVISEIASVKGINFDGGTGLFVDDLGNSNVFVRLNSSFKTINVPGANSLVAQGEDTLNVEAGVGIVLTTQNTNPKALVIAANTTYLNSTSRAAISVSGSPGSASYDNTTGVISILPDSNAGPFVFTTSGQYRIMSGFKEAGETKTIRTADFYTNSGTTRFRILLATFTPSFTASGNGTLNWDDTATSWSVSVTNPSDVLDQFISNVYSITSTAGNVSSNLSGYTAGARTPTPTGGVSWTQSFTATAAARIYSTTNDATGGTASATVNFYVNNGTADSQYTASTASWSTSWRTATHSISYGSFSPSTLKFLSYYTSIPYTVTVNNITSAGNKLSNVTPTGGSISSSTGSGTFTFDTPIHKNNTTTSRFVTLATTVSRPATVTGTAYSVALANVATSNPSFTVTYPSFWMFTTIGTQPTRADIVNGYAFDSTALTELADQVRTLAGTITNSTGATKVFWFGVRSAAAQPTRFQLGDSASLLAGVTLEATITVNLEPDSPLGGYTAEPYTLYGFNFQPGSAYVSIGI